MEEQFKLFEQWIKENRLLYIEVVLKGVGRKKYFGRLIQFDQQQKKLLVYDDDQKKMDNIMVNEIDCIQPV
jgi:hypothetical protein